jgi:hypothetical protein
VSAETILIAIIAYMAGVITIPAAGLIVAMMAKEEE